MRYFKFFDTTSDCIDTVKSANFIIFNVFYQCIKQNQRNLIAVQNTINLHGNPPLRVRIKYAFEWRKISPEIC